MPLNKEILNKNIRLVSNVMIFMYMFLFLSNNSFLGKNFQSLIHWGEAGTGFILICCFILKFIIDSKENKISFLKSNILVILFLVCTGLTFVYNGLTYSIIRTIFVVTIYILIINDYMFNAKFIKNVLLKGLIYFNLILNILPFVVSTIIKISDYNPTFLRLLDKYTYIGSAKASAYSCFYSNPNTMGIVTGLALLASFALYSKNYEKYQKVLFFVYVFFTSYILMASNCRSALLSVIVALLSYVVITLLKNKYAKQLIALGFLVITIICIAIVGFANNNKDTGLEHFSNTEKSIDKISSHRYSIWKSTYIAQQDMMLLGKGSLKHVVEDRDKYLEKNFGDYYTIEKFEYDNEDPKDLSKFDFLSMAFYKFEHFVSNNNFMSLYDLRVVMDKYYLGTTFLGYPREEIKLDKGKDNDSSTVDKTLFIDIVRELDSHNGYLSVLFCFGYIGFAVFVAMMLRKILTTKAFSKGRNYLIVVYCLVINFFESALIVDRFFICLFLMLALAIDSEVNDVNAIELEDCEGLYLHKN
ncbi:MAG: O-antigen ligase family protein [Eubacteriales bacterium]|nr:O-antigen ligase family protein [Eubacteriales bacterium]MDY3332629.1 O-antigen ligase family protein [Gallibacter sp.]